MELTDEELDNLHSLVYDYVYYGPSEVVYGDEGAIYRAILDKVTGEAERRKLWWAIP